METPHTALLPQLKGWVNWLSIALLAGSLTLMAKALLPLLMWGVSSTWLEVPARLVDVQVTPLQTPEERSRARKALYKNEVVYRYEMAGQTWTSTHWGWYNSSVFDVHSGEAVFERFRAAKGKNTLAWVNPRDPSQSVLYRQPVWGVDLFLMGCAGIALVLYLVVQLLTSPANQQARVQAMAKLALKSTSAMVLVFASALVLNDQMSHQPSWQLAAGALAFSALWVYAPLQLLKGLKQQQPIMKWRRWRAPLPAFVNPQTRLNEFEQAPPGATPSHAAVNRSHALLAALVVTAAGIAYNMYRPHIRPSVPTHFGLNSDSRLSQHIALTSPPPFDGLTVRGQIEVASTPEFRWVNVITPWLEVSSATGCDKACASQFGYMYLLVTRKGNSYCSLAGSGIQTLQLEARDDPRAPMKGVLKPFNPGLNKEMFLQKQPLWVVLVVMAPNNRYLFLHADAPLDLGYPVDRSLIGPGEEPTLALTSSEFQRLGCPSGRR